MKRTAVLLALFGACGSSHEHKAPGSSSNGSSAASASSIPQLAALPTLPAPPAAKPGIAYLGINNTGLVALDGGQFKPVGDIQYANSIATGPDGTVWVIGAGPVWKIPPGGAPQQLPEDQGMPDQVVPAGKDDAWFASSIGIDHWNGGGYESWKGADITGSDESLRGFAIDAKGRAVEVSDKHLNILDGKTWKHTDLGPVIGDMLPLNLVAGDDGKLYSTVMGGGLLVIDGDTPSMMTLPSGGDIDDVKYFFRGPPGELYAIGDKWFLVIRPADKGAHYVPFTADLGMIDAGAVDASGRVWLAGKAGVAVIDRAGQVTMFPNGTVPEFSAGIDAMAVTGGGPTLPAVGTVKKGSVAGTVVNGSAVQAGATVEICAEPRSVFDADSTPCAEEPFHLSTKTDGSGAFKFDDVPIGAYGFAILPAGGTEWTGSMRDFCKDMKEGQTCDVGPLDLAQ